MDDAAAANNDDPQSPTRPPPLAGTASAASAAVTVATTRQTLTHVLPIQQPFPASASASAANPNNGGREDCWSEGATSALIDAWGERYLDLGRVNLKQKHWQEIADAVSARDDYTKPPKSDVQCKNRIDTLKKKYKSEKSKIAAGQSHPSAWPFFHRLDILIGANFLNPPASAAAAKAPPPPPAFPPHFPQKTRTQTVVNHSTSVKKRSRSTPPPPPPQEDSDGLPPPERDGVGLRELTMAILMFGEVYERVERAKVQQMLELEKQRMEFARELELQRMQFFVKTQMELSQLDSRPHKRRGGGGGGGGGGENNHRRCLDHQHHPHRRHHQIADNGNSSE